jgi:predicted GNAT family acetyltransferase
MSPEMSATTTDTTRVTFRLAIESDLPALQQLVEQLYKDDGDRKPGRIELTYGELSARPDKGSLISFLHDGQIVGYAILIYFWSNEFGGTVIDIDELCISREHRGKGLATNFFSWLETSPLGRCAGWSLQVSHANSGAAKLYERLGFKLSANRHLIKLTP